MCETHAQRVRVENSVIKILSRQDLALRGHKATISTLIVSRPRLHRKLLRMTNSYYLRTCSFLLLVLCYWAVLA